MNPSRLFIIIALWGSIAAAEPTRIYLANDDHTDYMWTADAETYNALFTLTPRR